MSSVALRYGVVLLAVVAIGLVAGILMSTGMSGSTAKGLPEAMWTKSFQLEDALFAKVTPPLMLTTLAALMPDAPVTRGSVRGLFGAATVFMLVVLLVHRGEVPLNTQIQTWVPGTAPANWADIRYRWLANHLIGRLSGFLALSALRWGWRRL